MSAQFLPYVSQLKAKITRSVHPLALATATALAVWMSVPMVAQRLQSSETLPPAPPSIPAPPAPQPAIVQPVPFGGQSGSNASPPVRNTARRVPAPMPPDGYAYGSGQAAAAPVIGNGAAGSDAGGGGSASAAPQPPHRHFHLTPQQVPPPRPVFVAPPQPEPQTAPDFVPRRVPEPIFTPRPFCCSGQFGGFGSGFRLPIFRGFGGGGFGFHRH